MANEKISQFAIDADIEDIDGLAAMTITNTTTADPAGGVPIEYGNVALPGYAFTLGNILKTKTDRSDPDPANWSDVDANTIIGAQTGTVGVDKGIMFNDSPNTGNVTQIYSQSFSKFNIKSLRNGGAEFFVSDYKEFNYASSQTGSHFHVDVSEDTSNIKHHAGNHASSGAASVELYAKGTAPDLNLYSGEDINITSGKGQSTQQAGDVILTLGNTTPNAKQLLAAKDTSGTLAWQSESTYDLVTTISTGSIYVGLTKDASVSPVITSSIQFNEDSGIKFTNPVGSQTASFGIKANLNTTGGLKFSSTGEIELDLGYAQTGKNYAVQLDNNKLYVNVPWTDTDTTYSAATKTNLGLLKLGSNTTLTATYESGSAGTAVSNRAYPVQFNSSKEAAVYVPWSDTNTTYGAKSGGGLTLDNSNEFSISAPVSYLLGGTGTTTNTANGVVFAGSAAYQTGPEFTFINANSASAAATSTLSVGLSNTSAPDEGFQGIVQIKGQGDLNEDPYNECGRLELQCQTGGHNFHIVGPDHASMSYSPGIVLPSNIGKAGQVLVLDTAPNSGSVRTGTTKWETPANPKKTFVILSNGNGTNNNWVIKDGYNAKCDFTTSGTNQALDLDTMFDPTQNPGAVAGGDYGTLIVINGASAGTITFPTSSKWVGGGTPTPTDNGVDIYSFIYDGVNFYWTYGLDNKV